MYYPDLPISVAFGAIIVASQIPANAPVDKAALSRRSLIELLTFGLLFHLPCSTFAFIWYPDWNLGYYLPIEKVGWVGVLIAEAGLLGLLFAGRKAALALADRPKLIYAFIAAAFIVFGLVMVVVFDRYNSVGTYASYNAGRATPSVESPEFTMFTSLAGAYLIVPFLVLNGYNIINHRRVSD